MKKLNYIIGLIVILAGGTACKEVYSPPVTPTSTNLLVVDGIIVNGNDSSIIIISRTRTIQDSAPSVKESSAKVSVVGVNGVEYSFMDMGAGRYTTDQLHLDITQTYQLKIITTDGNEFRSALEKVFTSPPIDSLYWQQNSAGVSIYLNTKDPSNNSKYYRWQYEETWEYHSAFNSTLIYTGPVGQYVPRPISDQIFRCYHTVPSSTIEVLSTTQLSSNVVHAYEVTIIPAGSEKISEGYSNLVKQYAITADAFNYWQNLKKNTEQLGSLFDLQPFSELGNIRCLNNPALKCIGFISFSSVTQKRIFVSKNDLNSWGYQPYYGACSFSTLKPAETDALFQPPGGPYFNSLVGSDYKGNLQVASNLCADCTQNGGTTIKPPFWP